MRLVISLLTGAMALSLAACSQETQDNAEVAAERAAADAEANAEVVGNELREGAIVAADEISEGAANLKDNLEEADAADADPGDGDLDGTD
ncbi:hypothetical protein SAMN06297468_1658 [Altererythrobacter xiamenensis]|uniref:Uncharacterized protein n=1 Tax=Altererythrobacter xiamenensis TaxID=1316679 RepID=A0A1Y6F7W8_9SPHN|nr:hypothetical protein [Altererythrobacter xiamenensis]SMQ69470.1 hypothetical protein SAMN06297468_1658 [Altererythrobacter xiamenensis]